MKSFKIVTKLYEILGQCILLSFHSVSDFSRPAESIFRTRFSLNFKIFHNKSPNSNNVNMLQPKNSPILPPRSPGVERERKVTLNNEFRQMLHSHYFSWLSFVGCEFFLLLLSFGEIRVTNDKIIIIIIMIIIIIIIIIITIIMIMMTRIVKIILMILITIIKKLKL